MQRSWRVVLGGSMALAAGLASGCTLITGVNDFEVDPTVEVRDLDYTFSAFNSHAQDTLDVAVVAIDEDDRGQLQARARIVLPAKEGSSVPDERLVMTNALIPGDQRLYFFIDDSPENNRFDEKNAMGTTAEHVWVKDVAPSGVDEFVHSTAFVPFDETKDFSQLNGDVVLAPRGDAEDSPIIGPKLLSCLAAELDAQIESTFEVKIFLSVEARQVGLFKTYKGNPPPMAGEVRLRGIVDGGNDYRLEVYVDNKLTNSKDFTAPDSGDLRIGATDWLPNATRAFASCADVLRD